MVVKVLALKTHHFFNLFICHMKVTRVWSSLFKAKYLNAAIPWSFIPMGSPVWFPFLSLVHT